MCRGSLLHLWYNKILFKGGGDLVRDVSFSISEFAKFSRTTRDTLRHYDRIGLLSPATRGENNYRYYSSAQLAMVNVIRILQESGMTLNEIKKLKDNRSPELMDDLLARQIKKIDIITEEWANSRKLLATLQNSITSALNVNEEEITVRFMQEKPIILGDLNDYSRGRNAYDALVSFYNDIHKKHPDLNLNYSVWGTFSQDRIKQLDWIWPDRYYFNNPVGSDIKPAALYAVGYKRGDYGQSDELYRRIIDYIDNNGFEICGDAYEEYPLNEVCTTESKNYLMQVMITVREKNI
jgi:DNA-binding transcriptional MerR regulator